MMICTTGFRCTQHDKSSFNTYKGIEFCTHHGLQVIWVPTNLYHL